MGTCNLMTRQAAWLKFRKSGSKDEIYYQRKCSKCDGHGVRVFTEETTAGSLKATLQTCSVCKGKGFLKAKMTKKTKAWVKADFPGLRDRKSIDAACSKAWYTARAVAGRRSK